MLRVSHEEERVVGVSGAVDVSVDGCECEGFEPSGAGLWIYRRPGLRRSGEEQIKSSRTAVMPGRASFWHQNRRKFSRPLPSCCSAGTSDTGELISMASTLFSII